MKVAVVGSTGLVGGRVAGALIARGDDVVAVSRSGRELDGATAVAWNPADAPPPSEAFDGADAIVNMAGRPVASVPRLASLATAMASSRWTDERKHEMRTSRISTTQMICDALSGVSPRVLINASATGYYGPSDEPVVESDGPGAGFLAELCLDWEAAAARAAEAGHRVVVVRTGIVLDRDGGALPPLASATRMFAGGPLAGGRFWFPWIHIDDQIGVILKAIDDAQVSGPVNATAPNPVRQKEFAATLGKVLRRPSFVPTPSVAMRVLFGEGAEAVLSGQPVLPAAIQEAGYEFRFPYLEQALRDLLT